MGFQQLLLENGYEMQSTWWNDFTIADKFGISAITDTYKRGFETAKALGKVYITELVIVLNHKIWYWYHRNDKVARVYNNLYEQARDWAEKNLSGEDLQFFYRITD